MDGGTSYKPGRIRLRQPGKLTKTTYANEIAGVLNDLNPQYVTGRVDPEQTWTFSFLAKIVTAGPDGEADYTDRRYWVEPQILEDDPVYDLPQFANDHSITPRTIITATNQYELTPVAAVPVNEHALQLGLIVRVFAEVDRGGSVRYIFERPQSSLEFGVDVAQVGGVAGSKSAFSTFTYDVKRVDTSEVISSSALQPKLSPARAFKCKAVAGDKGGAYYNATGALVLAWVNETTALCSRTFVTGVTCNGDGTVSVTTDTAMVVDDC